MKVFDFFSGCGGTSQGLKDAGFDIEFALDWDKDSTDTFKRNFPNALVINEDIRNFHPSRLSGAITRSRGPNIFCGCAPCQPFSKQNMKKRQEDERLDLLSEFAKFVEFWKPDYVLVENVPGLQKVERSDVLVRFKDRLDKLGYNYDCNVLRCSDYGIPQKRERFILVASKGASVQLPQPSHGPGCEEPFSTVADWILDLPNLAHGEIHDSDPDHQAARLAEINLLRIRATPQGGDRTSWPTELQLSCHQGHSGHSDVYGRLSWNKLASGLTTRCVSYSNGRFGHPTQDRAISLREAACLQTFPRNFGFCGSLTARAKQVGNAVPPLLATAIGNSLKSQAKL